MLVEPLLQPFASPSAAHAVPRPQRNSSRVTLQKGLIFSGEAVGALVGRGWVLRNPCCKGLLLVAVNASQLTLGSQTTLFAPGVQCLAESGSRRQLLPAVGGSHHCSLSHALLTAAKV